MAKMVPTIAGSDTKSDGEIKVFEGLKNSELTKDWIVLHSLDLAAHVSQLSGEIDFLIFIPDYGCLCLEVKACRSLKRETGSWYYGNSTTPDNRGPFRQAEAAKHSVIEYLKRRAGGTFNIPIFSSVIFTHIPFNEKSAEWNSHQVIDLAIIDRDGIPLALLNSIKSHRKCFDEKFGALRNLGFPTAKDIKAAVALLRPEFEVFESAKARARRVNEEVKKYTGEQFDALDYAQYIERIAFDGPAGTGKSILALEITRRFLMDGKSVLFLCYNSLLGEFLNREASYLTGNIYCGTIDSFMLKATGLSPSNDQNFWKNILPQNATKALSGSKPKFDVLIVDEAQDFMNLTYLDVLDACVVGGLEKGIVKFFGDFVGQAVQNSDLTLSDLSSTLIEDLKIVKLTKNCRNTPRVASLATGFVRDRVVYKTVLRPDDDIRPSVRYYESDKNQGEMLFAELAEFRDKGLPFEEIAILSCSRKQEAAKALVDVIYGPGTSIDDVFTQSGLVVTTIRKFKGLERHGIIITDVGDVEQRELEELLYIASTRSTHMLTIFIKDVLKQQLHVRENA